MAAPDIADQPIQLARDHADQFGARHPPGIVRAACDWTLAVVFRPGHRDHLPMVGRAGDGRSVYALQPFGLKAADAPSFERYDENFDPRTGNGGLEIWVPVRE